jgi:hypothetical protein
MSPTYLLAHLMPGYSAIVQINHRLNPGDGFEGLHFRPVWF